MTNYIVVVYWDGSIIKLFQQHLSRWELDELYMKPNPSTEELAISSLASYVKKATREAELVSKRRAAVESSMSEAEREAMEKLMRIADDAQVFLH